MYKYTSIIIVLVVLLISSCKNNQESKIKNNDIKTKILIDSSDAFLKQYQLDLDSIYIFHDKLTFNKLEKTIPKSQEEFSYFYSYTYKNNELYDKIFYKICDSFYKWGFNNKNNFLLKLLEMSILVDGEFAETYFDEIDACIDNNKYFFCNNYSKLTIETQSKFLDKFNSYCKN